VPDAHSSNVDEVADPGVCRYPRHRRSPLLKNGPRPVTSCEAAAECPKWSV